MNTTTAAGIFERHHLAVFRFLRHMTQSQGLAEDLTQEVFLRVVRGLGGYDERSLERAWVFRIARNVLLDEGRRQARRPLGVSLEDAAEPARAANQGLTLALRQALEDLPDDDRQAFLLREVGGLGYDEIAEATGATRDAARMRIYRARLALRMALSPQASSKRTEPIAEISK